MILHIDTKDQKQVKVSLRTRESTGLSPAQAGKVVASLSEENQFGSQVLLPLIIKLIRTYKPGLSSQFQTGFGKLKAIEVETGPGSFTGIRVGVSVANALGYGLGITVNGKKIETELLYS